MLFLVRIDRIHSKFSRFFVKCFGYPCPLVSPRKRFLLHDMLFLYKCVNSSFSCDLVQLFGIHVNSRNLRSCPTFNVPFSRVNVCKRSFTSRLPSQYNSLPNSNNIDIFYNSFSTFRTLILRNI